MRCGGVSVPLRVGDFGESQMGAPDFEVPLGRGKGLQRLHATCFCLCQSAAHLARQPFGKVPALSHDGMTLYETSAITHYVDDVVPGPKLQPGDAKSRARMNQIMGVVDSYAYPSMISVVFQRVVNPLLGAPTDEKAVAEAKPKAEKSLAALESLADSSGRSSRRGAGPRGSHHGLSRR